MAIVLAALLVATMVGAVWAIPSRGAQAADIVRKVTIPAAFFHPTTDGMSYSNYGAYIALGGGTNATFTAPVVFPTLSAVTVKKITLSVKDNNGSYNACVTLYRTSPKNLSEATMATACSTGSMGQTTYDDDTIDHAVVYPAHGPYLKLTIGAAAIDVYGVTIECQRKT